MAPDAWQRISGSPADPARQIRDDYVTLSVHGRRRPAPGPGDQDARPAAAHGQAGQTRQLTACTGFYTKGGAFVAVPQAGHR